MKDKREKRPVVMLERPEVAKNLFREWTDTSLLSCLEGVMGVVYGDDKERPKAARAVLGDFSFFGGTPTEELALLEGERQFHILVPTSESWVPLFESCFGERLKPVVRYATKKEPGVFDRKKLEEAAASLPSGYELKMIDEEIYRQCRMEKWSRDLVSNYPDYETYRRLGLGTAVLKDGAVAAGVSSYSSYSGGIEIEIDTKEEHRRKGLAYAGSARLLLECLDRGLYPSWDAANLKSLGLAKKLGYHFDCEYAAYELYGK